MKLWKKLREKHRFHKLHKNFFESLTYYQDGLATCHKADFIHEEKFARAYKKGWETNSWKGQHIHWRAYIVCWAASRALQTAGDFVECGVNRGGLAMSVIEYTNFSRQNRIFYLLDTFCGLPADHIQEEEKKNGILPGGYEECYEAVKNTFKKYPNILLVRGPVPGTLSQVPSQKIAFLSIDLNCAFPEQEALRYFWPKISPGGAVVLDDYGWRGREAQKNAIDKLQEKLGFSVLSLPTGQGLIIK